MISVTKTNDLDVTISLLRRRKYKDKSAFLCFINVIIVFLPVEIKDMCSIIRVHIRPSHQKIKRSPRINIMFHKYKDIHDALF